ncbi:MAG: hypothetical protein O4753_12730 [Trichodesmium sp. St7_bin2_1]|nr:hypothetical protein [Trichodesmium sp. St7_bin2_1]
MHATSLQGFGYGDVVHQFKKRCKTNFSVKTYPTQLLPLKGAGVFHFCKKYRSR